MGQASGHKPGLRPESRVQTRDPASGLRPVTRLKARDQASGQGPQVLGQGPGFREVV